MWGFDSLKSWWESPPTMQSLAQSVTSVYDSLWPTRDAATPATDNPVLWTSPPPPPEIKREPTWDEMTWYQKAWTFGTSIIPGAVADSAGVTTRPGAVTGATVVRDAVQGVKDTIQSPTVILWAVVVGVIGLSFLAFMFRPVR